MFLQKNVPVLTVLCNISKSQWFRWEFRTTLLLWTAQPPNNSP